MVTGHRELQTIICHREENQTGSFKPIDVPNMIKEANNMLDWHLLILSCCNRNCLKPHVELVNSSNLVNTMTKKALYGQQSKTS